MNKLCSEPEAENSVPQNSQTSGSERGQRDQLDIDGDTAMRHSAESKWFTKLHGGHFELHAPDPSRHPHIVSPLARVGLSASGHEKTPVEGGSAHGLKRKARVAGSIDEDMRARAPIAESTVRVSSSSGMA